MLPRLSFFHVLLKPADHLFKRGTATACTGGGGAMIIAGILRGSEVIGIAALQARSPMVKKLRLQCRRRSVGCSIAGSLAFDLQQPDKIGNLIALAGGTAKSQQRHGGLHPGKLV